MCKAAGTLQRWLMFTMSDRWMFTPTASWCPSVLQDWCLLCRSLAPLPPQLKLITSPSSLTKYWTKKKLEKCHTAGCGLCLAENTCTTALCKYMRCIVLSLYYIFSHFSNIDYIMAVRQSSHQPSLDASGSCVCLCKIYQLYVMILSTNVHTDNDWNLFNIHYNWGIVFLHMSNQFKHNKIQQLRHTPPLICCKTNFCLCISAPYNCKTTTLTMNTKLGKHSGAKDNYAKKEFVIKLN